MNLLIEEQMLQAKQRELATAIREFYDNAGEDELQDSTEEAAFLLREGRKHRNSGPPIRNAIHPSTQKRGIFVRDPDERGSSVAVGQKIFNWLFGCRHRELSRAFTSGNETYKVCLKCGARLKYSWQTMSLVGEDDSRKPASEPTRKTGSGKAR